MNRRTLLKLIGAAIVAPFIPLAKEQASLKYSGPGVTDWYPHQFTIEVNEANATEITGRITEASENGEWHTFESGQTITAKVQTVRGEMPQERQEQMMVDNWITIGEHNGWRPTSINDFYDIN